MARFHECNCRTKPLLTGRSEEESFGIGPFLGLAAFAALLGAVHFYVRDWGWVAWLVMLALEFVCLLVLWFFINEVRAQKRHGLIWIRLDSESAQLGGQLGVTIGPGRNLAGLEEVEVRLRCVEAFLENREGSADESGKPVIEEVRVCYELWEDSRKIKAPDLSADRDARAQLTLPLAKDLAGPPGNCQERYWELEVARRGGASDLQFRVLVYP